MSFAFDFTQEKLAHCAKRNKDIGSLYSTLSRILPRYDITTPERVAAFLAQCGHESVDFTVLKENLNYSAKGLVATWPKRFLNEEAAMPYNRDPEKIANRVYADRMGNGDEASGDGWRYRGRGAIQLTGRDNYSSFAKSINKTLDETVEYLETLSGAVESAAWFWQRNNLNLLADARDIVTMTRRINGGTIGLEDRRNHYEHNLKVLKG